MSLVQPRVAREMAREMTVAPGATRAGWRLMALEGNPPVASIRTLPPSALALRERHCQRLAEAGLCTFAYVCLEGQSEVGRRGDGGGGAHLAALEDVVEIALHGVEWEIPDECFVGPL